jgi:hypothetical protein
VKKKRSAKQRANDARLRKGLKPKKQNGKRKTTKRKRSTRKYGVRKTARRAYVGLKKRTKRRKKTKDSSWSF